MKSRSTIIHVAFHNAFDFLESGLEKMLYYSEQKLEKWLGKKIKTHKTKLKQNQERKKELQELARFQEYQIKIHKECIVEKRLSELELHNNSPAQHLDRA